MTDPWDEGYIYRHIYHTVFAKCMVNICKYTIVHGSYGELIPVEFLSNKRQKETQKSKRTTELFVGISDGEWPECQHESPRNTSGRSGELTFRFLFNALELSFIYIYMYIHPLREYNYLFYIYTYIYIYIHVFPW